MRYVLVSDIHGNYDKLQDALNSVNFDKDKDTLISVGDAFDRGTQNFEVLEFLVNLPHKILLFGNHCLRLKELVDKKSWYDYCDWTNGTIGTIEELAELKYDLEECIEILRGQKTEGAKLLKKYFSLCHYAVEFDNLYVTHAWLPYKESGFKIRNTWKTATAKSWYDATWANNEALINHCKMFPNDWPDKTILIGHWHAFRIAEKCYDIPRNYKKAKPDGSTEIDCTTFVSPDNRVIAIDGCTSAVPGVVNAYIVESDTAPKIY